MRVVASADSFMTRTLTIIASGATPTFWPATSEATLVPCEAPTNSIGFEKHGFSALLGLAHFEAPTTTDRVASNPAMTRLAPRGDPNSVCVARTPVSMM